MNRSRRTRDRGREPRLPPRRALLELSDERLVDLVLEGHEVAFEVLFERHVADSLWYAREVLGSWGEAEEAVRHSFAAAHAYLASRGRETEFAPWLHTILGNHCLSMLQARTPGSGRSADDANVVDLGEWRLRRKLFGAALPVAPGAALRDSVMAACGIGAGGAATTGAPLLGGALAKLAVVAVLAGGAGVAGDVASEPASPADAGSRAPVERTAQTTTDGSDMAAGAASKRPRRARVLTRESVGDPDGAPRVTLEPLARRDDVPEDGPAPAEQAPPHALALPTGQGPSGPAPAAGLADAVVPTTVASPTPATLRHAIDVVKTHVTVAGDLSRTQLPGAVELSEIGDDLGVTAVEPPVDVHALLSQGTIVLPK